MDDELDELIETYIGLWAKSEVQMESLKVLWKTLPDPLRDHYAHSLARLYTKQFAAWNSLHSVDTKQEEDKPQTTLRRLKDHTKWLHMRPKIKKAISDLEDWQSKFDPSWYLITRIASVTVDEQLQDVPQSDASRRLIHMRQAIKKLNLSTTENDEGTARIFRDLRMNSDKIRQILSSNTFITFYADSQQPVLLDRTNFPPDTPMDRVRPDVRNLARLLQNVDPVTFGLLKCKGVIEWHSEGNKPVSQFQFILDIPKGLSSTPTTLRQILVEQNQFPLNERVRLARQLARSVLFVHTTGFVHKSIRPETIIVFAETNGNASSKIGQSFLTGFERFRRDGGPSDLLEDLDWAKNLYRHPQRQGMWPEDLFKMQHDVYSLGMCLLEIGLWSSFVRTDGRDMVPWSELEILTALAERDPKRKASIIKRRMVRLAKDRLPGILGERYTNLTTACLTCLDKGDENTFGTEKDLRDQDGILVGVRYIEKVSFNLQ
jgi:hypothetical protein